MMMKTSRRACCCCCCCCLCFLSNLISLLFSYETQPRGTSHTQTHSQVAKAATSLILSHSQYTHTHTHARAQQGSVCSQLGSKSSLSPTQVTYLFVRPSGSSRLSVNCFFSEFRDYCLNVSFRYSLDSLTRSVA